MTTQLADTIDLGLLTDVPSGTEMHVTREDLCKTLDANRRRGTKRRLSAEQHVDLALRYKNGEPGAGLAREYGVSQGSIAQVVSRVERAADSLVRARRKGRDFPRPAADTRTVANTAGTPGRPVAAERPVAAAGGTRTAVAEVSPRGPAHTTANPDTGIAVGPFLREVLDAIRPMAGPEKLSPGHLRRIAASLERIASLMRRRADQVGE